MKKTALVPIADGTEEIEAVCIIDVLRRADVDVTVASVSGALQITASRGVKVVADRHIAECAGQTYDLIVLPGGMPGAEHLRDSPELRQLLEEQVRAGRLYGAICAAPAVVLQSHGLLKERGATCHPSFMEKLSPGKSSRDRVVTDGNCVTSQGPGTALAFTLKLVALLCGEEKARQVADPMIIS